jgi:GAF domain-containing protein
MTGTAVVDAHGEVIGVIGVLSDNSARHRTERDVRTREQQAETVAVLGARALREGRQDRELFLGEAVDATRRVLGAEHAAFLELAPGGHEFVVQVDLPVTGMRTIPTGTRSFAGYTALAGQVVSVEDAHLDRRFEIASAPGVSFTVVAAIAAPVLGPSGVRGVVIATWAAPHAFEPSDGHFMQGVANVIGIALQPPRS